ncbi:MAG TPA: signal peptidase I, partial [Candidatus Limnocylindrales bacterium]
MALGFALATWIRRLLDLVLVALIVIVLAAVTVTRVIPAITGAPTFVVAGGSMEPAVPLGSVVVTSPVAASDLRPGDVVSLRVGSQQAVFTHRITRIVPRDGAIWIETKGDANPTIDPSILPATSVVGRVDAAIPYLGYVVQLLVTAQGVVFLLSLGLVTLLGVWLLEGLEGDLRQARD